MAAIAIEFWKCKTIVRSSHRRWPVQVLFLIFIRCSGCLCSKSSGYLIFNYSMLSAVFLDAPCFLLLLALGCVDLVEELTQLRLCLWVVDHCLFSPSALTLNFIMTIVSRSQAHHLLSLFLNRVQSVHRRIIESMLEVDWLAESDWWGCRGDVKWSRCSPRELGSYNFCCFDWLRKLYHTLTELRHLMCIKFALGVASAFGEVMLRLLSISLNSNSVCLVVQLLMIARCQSNSVQICAAATISRCFSHDLSWSQWSFILDGQHLGLE